MSIFKSLIINIISIALATLILTSVSIHSAFALLLVSIVITVLNRTLLPIMLMFGATFIILTFGLGIFVIDALVFLLAAKIVTGFVINSFWAAVWLSLITSIINGFLIPKKDAK